MTKINNFFYNNRFLVNIFFTSLLFKIFISFFYGSYFFTDLFVPFINYSTNVSLLDSYNYFDSIGLENAFPYPAFMLFVLSAPQYLFGWIINNIYFDYFLLRLPLIIADLIILFTAHSWLSKKYFFRFFYLYWLSPVLFFISYVYGQIDVIPIALLFLSLTFIYRDNLYLSSIFLGLSLATKTMVLICFPFIFLFLLKKETSFKTIIIFFTITFIIFILPNLPFFFTENFFKMVFQNTEQIKIFNAKFVIMNSEIYLIPLLFIILIVRCYSFKKLNRDIFNMFLGFSFGIILLCVEPREGWYFWLLPFLFYFFSKSSNKSLILIFTLQLFYFIYFFSNDLLLILSNIIKVSLFGLTDNLIFTLLQGILIVNCYFIYQYGLISYTKYKFFYQNFLLGIGGDSGSGKSTLSKAFSKIFNKNDLTVVKGDDIHKWERNDLEWEKYTHLNPKANDLHLEINMLRKLKIGRSIKRKEYDHISGKFLKERVLYPKNMIIYEGLLPFFLEKQRNQFDLKVFISPDMELVKFWKINRDINERNKSIDDIVKQIKERKLDSDKYIITQKQFADIIIVPKISLKNNLISEINDLINSNKIKNIETLKLKLASYNKEDDIDFTLIFPNSISFDIIFDIFSKHKSVKINHKYIDSKHQEIKISGNIDQKEISYISKSLIPGLDHIGITQSIWPQNSYGLVMLFIIYMIFEEVNID